MSGIDENRRSSQFLAAEIKEFLIDRQARNYTPSTLAWYRRCLAKWLDFCESKALTPLTM